MFAKSPRYIAIAGGRVTTKVRSPPRPQRVSLVVRGSKAMISSILTSGFAATAALAVRDIAARLPTITLLEELERRAALDSTTILADAMLADGHPLAAVLAEFPERVSALRREAENRRASLRPAPGMYPSGYSCTALVAVALGWVNQLTQDLAADLGVRDGTGCTRSPSPGPGNRAGFLDQRRRRLAAHGGARPGSE